MLFRTDLAVELNKQVKSKKPIECITEERGQLKITEIKVKTGEEANSLKRPIGTYINIDVPDLIFHSGEYNLLEDLITEKLCSLNFPKNNILVAGLGNKNITPDTLGPCVANRILATRHLSKELKEETGLKELYNVSVIMPGVLGQTGIETKEIIKGVVKAANIEGVLLIDAFAANDINRLATTIQICDSGISPGSGVGNNRAEISKATMGIPVIAVGVPTCIDIGNLFSGKKGNMIVAPRDIDLLIDRSAEVLSRAINRFLQPKIEPEFLMSIV